MSSTSTTVSGRVLQINPTKVVTEKFSKRELILLVDPGKYEQEILIEAAGAQIEMLDALRVDDEVKAECNLRGRRWDGPNGTKWFLELRLWKIETTKHAGAGGGGNRETRMPAAGTDDDIPFASSLICDEPSAIARILR